MIHMICGPAGAGKTTFARKLADDFGGVRFSIDEWMMTLFGDDVPTNISPGWITPRLLRCDQQVWSIAAQLGARGTPAILDLGFQRAEHRRRFAALAAEAALPAMLHVLNTGITERWRRVEQRNQQRGETFHMEVTRQMFDYSETFWEPPRATEIEEINTVTTP